MGFLNDLFGAKNNNYAQTSTGAGTINNTAGNQSALFDMLMNRAQGNGPSAAEQMLNRSTDRQIGQQASAIAGIKGLNPALAAKMIADNNATRLMDTTGAAGVQRAQEQASASGLLAGALGQERGRQTQESLGVQGINAQVGAGNAGQNAATAGSIGGLLGLADGGEVPNFDVAEVHVPTIEQQATPLIGGDKKAGGGGDGANMIMKILPALMSSGGEIPEFIQKFAGGGSVVPTFSSGLASAGSRARTNGQGQSHGLLGDALTSLFSTSTAPDQRQQQSHGLLGNALMSLFSPTAPDQVPGSGPPTSLDYATMYGAPDAAGGGTGNYSSQDYANLYGAPGANTGVAPAPMKAGGKIPGKANVSGDSEKNDTVPILASPGEVVLPRSKAKDPEKAAEFVEALNKSREKKGSGGYGNVLRAQEQLHNRLSQIERFCYGGKV